MKKIFVAIVTVSTISFASAVTVSDSQLSTECLKTSGPTESYTCAVSDTTVTYNNNVPAGNVLITLDSHSVGDGGGLAPNFGMLRCGAPYGGGPWGAGPGCSSGDVTTRILGNGSSWGVIGGPSGGSVNPTLSAGTYNISLDADVYNGSYPTWCVVSFPDSCSVLDTGDNSGGTLTVTAAASVNLNIGIGQWFEDKIEKLLSLFTVDKALAQTGVVSTTTPRTKAIIVANINLTETKLTKISEDNYNVSFVLTNQGEKQEDVQYRFSFIDSKEKPVLTQIFRPNLTLEKNKPVFINEKLMLPEGLSGTYILRVQAVTSSGLPLGTGIAGQIALEGSNTPRLSACVPDREGYEKNEVLPITCSVVGDKPLASYAKEQGGYIVTTKAYLDNAPVESSSAMGEISANKGTALLKGLSTPGIYTLVSQLTTRSGVPAGKEVVNYFTINGTSVSITNLLLDKDYYAVRDKAQATGAFSVFSSNRNTRLSLVATLAGSRGECASELRQEMVRRTAVQLSLPVTERCVNPMLTMKVLNERGVVLAEKTLALESKDVPLSSEAKTLLAVIGLAVLFYVARHEKVLPLLKKSVTKKGKK